MCKLLPCDFSRQKTCILCQNFSLQKLSQTMQNITSLTILYLWCFLFLCISLFSTESLSLPLLVLYACLIRHSDIPEDCASIRLSDLFQSLACLVDLIIEVVLRIRFTGPMHITDGMGTLYSPVLGYSGVDGSPPGFNVTPNAFCING